MRAVCQSTIGIQRWGAPPWEEVREGFVQEAVPKLGQDGQHHHAHCGRHKGKKHDQRHMNGLWQIWGAVLPPPGLSIFLDIKAAVFGGEALLSADT